MIDAKRYKFRVSAIVGIVLFFLSLAAVSVSAYEPCRSFVTAAVTKTEWPHYTAATVARWRKWGKDHPHYQAPKRQPRVTTKEVQHMVDVACATPELELNANQGLLEEIPYEAPAYEVNAPRPYMVENYQPPSTTMALLNTPVVITPALPGEAPEPQAWVLAATGLLFIGFCLWRRDVDLSRHAC